MSEAAGVPAPRPGALVRTLETVRGWLNEGAERVDATRRYAGVRFRRIVRRLAPHLLPYTLAESRRAEFRRIPEFRGPEWRGLEDAVMVHERHLAVAQVAGRFAGIIVAAYLLLPVGLLLLRATPVAADLLTGVAYTAKNPGPYIGTLVRSTLGFVLGLVAVTLVALRQALRNEGRHPSRLIRMGNRLALTAALAVIVRYTFFPPTFRGRVSLTGDDWTAMTLALMVAALFITAFLTRRVVRLNVRPARRRVHEEAPAALVVHELVNVLARTSEGGAARWTEVARKRELMSSLATVARAMHPHLGNYFRVGSGELDRWTAKRCAQMSAAVQELAQLVFSPHEEAFAEFRQRTVRLLSTVARGNWDDVPRGESDGTPPESRISGAAATIRRVSVVLAPALLVGGYRWLEASEAVRNALQDNGLSDLPPLPEAAYVGVVLMTVTGIAGVLNPQVQADVSLAKSMMDLLSVGKK